MKIDFDKYIIGKVLSENRGTLFPIILFAIILLIPIILTNGSITEDRSIESWWDNWLEPWIGLLTFLVAIFIAYTNYKQAEINKLDKLINVHYKYEENFILSYWGAYLSHESDIRQWGMQIGVQMTKVKFLQFYPYIDESGPVKEYWNDKYYNVYTVTFFLKELPQYANDSRVKLPKDSEMIYDFKEQYLIWADNNNPHEPGYNEYILKQVVKTLDPRKPDEL